MIFFVHAVFIGAVGTGLMDLIGLAQRRLLGIPSLNYAMVGRWIGHIPNGQVIHRSIGQSPPVAYEAALGWAAHYLIGIIFGAILLLLAGPEWARAPGPVWPLLFGAATVVAPFLTLQPGMGAGLAARKTPNPWKARLRSLSAHVAFGLGLWLGARLWATGIWG